MKRALEFSVFLGIATLLHVALGLGAPRTGGDAGGSGGDAFVTLQGSNAMVAETIAAWTKPPKHQSDVTQALLAPVSDSTAPDLPTFQVESNPRAQVQIAALPRTEPPAAPQLNMETATPQPQPEPEQAPKPIEQAKPAPKTQPAKPKAVPTQAAPSQRASGSGGSAQSGQSGKTKALGSGQNATLVAQWGAKIRSKIERNKRLPRGVRGTGVTHMRIRVAPSGQLVSAQVIKSSGIKAYDDAALGAVTRAGRFAKAPNGLTDSNYSFRFSLRFTR